MEQPRPDKAPVEPPTFEEALSQLETIVRELEEGDIGLAVGLARYEQGIRLLKDCYQLLERAERRIQLLSHVDSEGAAHCEPFDDGAHSLEEKGQARGKRRSRAENRVLPTEDEIDGTGQLF